MGKEKKQQKKRKKRIYQQSNIQHNDEKELHKTAAQQSWVLPILLLTLPSGSSLTKSMHVYLLLEKQGDFTWENSQERKISKDSQIPHAFLQATSPCQLVAQPESTFHPVGWGKHTFLLYTQKSITPSVTHWLQEEKNTLSLDFFCCFAGQYTAPPKSNRSPTVFHATMSEQISWQPG